METRPGAARAHEIATTWRAECKKRDRDSHALLFQIGSIVDDMARDAGLSVETPGVVEFGSAAVEVIAQLARVVGRLSVELDRSGRRLVVNRELAVTRRVADGEG